jgi:hypothetical protein
MRPLVGDLAHECRRVLALAAGWDGRGPGHLAHDGHLLAVDFLVVEIWVRE